VSKIIAKEENSKFDVDSGNDSDEDQEGSSNNYKRNGYKGSNKFPAGYFTGVMKKNK
jgi:hypothetical protein